MAFNTKFAFDAKVQNNDFLNVSNLGLYWKPVAVNTNFKIKVTFSNNRLYKNVNSHSFGWNPWTKY